MIFKKSTALILPIIVAVILLSCNTKSKEITALTAHNIKFSSGMLHLHKDFHSDHIDDRNVVVWLPEEYTDKEKYQVLYMHDGQMLFDASQTWNGQAWKVDEVLSTLIKKGDVPKTIVVGAYNNTQNGKRHTEYFPEKPFYSLDEKFRDSLLNDAGHGDNKLFKGIASDAYLKFLVEELKPFVDKTYSTNASKEGTFVAGSSMGGLISMYAICEYPDVFAGAGCLSTHWTGTFTAENNPIPMAFANYIKEHLPDPETHKIYFDYGTETLDALYEPFQLKVDTVMQSKGYSEKNWMTKKFEGADHSENAWNARLDIPLKFLLN